MTPQEIIQTELRDIHLPPLPEAVSAAGGGFSLWPLVVAGVLVVLLQLWAWRRRSLWRRQARAALADALAREGVAEQWQALTALRARLAEKTPLPAPPEALYWPPERIGEADIAALARQLKAAV